MPQRKSSSTTTTNNNNTSGSGGTSGEDAPPLLSLSRLIRILIWLIVATHIGFMVMAGLKNAGTSTATLTAGGANNNNHHHNHKVASNTDFDFLPTMTTKTTKHHTINNNSTATIKKEAIAATTTTIDPQQNHNPFHTAASTSSISLKDLVQNDVTCQSGETPLESILLFMDDDGDSSLQTHTIPRIIHVATKTRCLPKNLKDAILNWKDALGKNGATQQQQQHKQHKQQQFSLVVHDEAAVDRLLAKYWLEFPQLQKLQNCIIHGRAKLNLWRLLVLWEYGGIFINWIDAIPSAVLPTLSKHVNVDNSSNNNNATAIPPTDALLFFDPPNIHTNDNTTTIYSHVMAASPHHPFFHSAILMVMSELLYMKEVGTGMDIIATGGRRTFSNMVRVFMRRNHNPQDKNTERYLEEYCVNHNNNNDDDDGKTNVWTGIGQRQLTTLATIRNNNNNDNTTLSTSPRASLGAAQFELSSKRDAVYPPPGQDHHDVCIQHMYKQDVKNHIGKN